MAIEKLLHNIQVGIKDLAPTLETFVESSIQPTVKDCEKLRAQFQDLLQDLAVYRHFREQHEVSPSFNIHAKLSEVIVETPPAPAVPKSTQVVESTPEVQPAESEPAHAVKPLNVSLNDKFRFINELFAGNSSEYGIAIEQFSNLRTWAECEIYINSLRSVYEWDDTQDIVKQLIAILRRRYS